MTKEQQRMLAYAVQAIDRMLAGLAGGAGIQDWERVQAGWHEATEPLRTSLQAELDQLREN